MTSRYAYTMPHRTTLGCDLHIKKLAYIKMGFEFNMNSPNHQILQKNSSFQSNMVFPRNAQTFEAFFESWLIRQESYLQELLRSIVHNDKSSGKENELRSKELVNRVMAHYKEYFEAKARSACENVFLVLTPPWLSSLERAYLWIGGFRTGLAFRLVFNNVRDLTEDQSQRINALVMQIKEEETELTNELTRLQDGMASPTMVELARNLGRPRNGEVAEMESTLARLRSSMETLVQCADSLRMKAVIRLMEMLKPSQGVKFLAAAAHLQLNLRRCGMQRDSQMQGLPFIRSV